MASVRHQAPRRENRASGAHSSRGRYWDRISDVVGVKEVIHRLIWCWTSCSSCWESTNSTFIARDVPAPPQRNLPLTARSGSPAAAHGSPAAAHGSPAPGARSASLLVDQGRPSKTRSPPPGFLNVAARRSRVSPTSPSATAACVALARRPHGNCANPIAGLFRCIAIVARADDLNESP